jgi:hypothetical protein
MWRANAKSNLDLDFLQLTAGRRKLSRSEVRGVAAFLGSSFLGSSKSSNALDG